MDNLVYTIKCACATTLTQRAKKTTLVCNMAKVIYASDFSTSNLIESTEIHNFSMCDCKIRDVSCKTCNKNIGYHVIKPCLACSSSSYLPFFWLFYPEDLEILENKTYTWENIPALPEKPEIDFFNVVPDYLLCGICFNVIEEAVILKCGHTFCRICIVRAIDLNNKCPLDNSFINNEMVFPNFIARDFINDLLISCRKCKKIIKLGEKKAHENNICKKN